MVRIFSINKKQHWKFCLPYGYFVSVPFRLSPNVLKVYILTHCGLVWVTIALRAVSQEKPLPSINKISMKTEKYIPQIYI